VLTHNSSPLKFVLICVETRADKAVLAATKDSLRHDFRRVHKREALPAKKEQNLYVRYKLCCVCIFKAASCMRFECVPLLMNNYMRFAPVLAKNYNRRRVPRARARDVILGYVLILQSTALGQLKLDLALNSAAH
jgi:hypothetical protein